MENKEKKGVWHWMRLLFGSPVGTVGFITLLLVILASLFAGRLSPYDPAKQNLLDKLMPPAWCEDGTADHLLGTDSLGRDVLTRCLYGARISLVVGVCSVAVAGVIGTALGLLSGYYGGWVDSSLSISSLERGTECNFSLLRSTLTTLTELLSFLSALKPMFALSFIWFAFSIVEVIGSRLFSFT